MRAKVGGRGKGFQRNCRRKRSGNRTKRRVCVLSIPVKNECAVQQERCEEDDGQEHVEELHDTGAHAASGGAEGTHTTVHQGARPPRISLRHCRASASAGRRRTAHKSREAYRKAFLPPIQKFSTVKYLKCSPIEQSKYLIVLVERSPRTGDRAPWPDPKRTCGSTPTASLAPGRPRKRWRDGSPS